jgi:hypothetical protein
VSPLTHAAGLLAIALCLALAHGLVVGWPGPPKKVLPAIAATVALPLPLLLIFGAENAAWCGKEGWLEVATEGVLLYGVGLGLLRRNPWIFLGAALLLVEELDYGQVLFGFQTPALLEQLGSRSDNLNFHNLPGIDGAWRWVPMLALLALALWPRPPLRLPKLHRATAWALGLTLALSVPTVLLAGGDLWNESFELALAALVLFGWQAANVDRAPPPPSGLAQ